MLSPLKVATPLDAVTVVEPESVAPEVPVSPVIEMATYAEEDVIKLP